MANEVIGIEVAVKLDQLRAQLATLGPGMEKEAAAMTAALNKQLKAQTAAVKQQTAAMTAAQRSGIKQIGDQAADAGTKFDKLGKAMGPIGGVLARISPEAGAVASSIAGITSAAEGVAASGLAGTLAGLLPLLGPLGGAILTVRGTMEDYTAATKAAEAANTAFALALAPLDVALAAAKDEQQLLNDALDSGAAKQYLAVADMSAKVDAKEAEATKGLREEKEALMQMLAESANMENSEGILAQQRIERIDKEIGLVHEQANALAQLTVANDTTRKFIDKITESKKAEGVAVEDTTEAQKEAADENERISAARYAEHIAATKQHIEHQERERERRLEITKTIIDGEKADREEAQKTADEQKKHDDDRKAARQQTIQDAATVTDSIMALGNQLLQNEINNLDTSTKEGRKTAMDLWHVQQGLAIARAALDAVAAISAASTLVPPANYVAMTVAGITGAINIAAVAGTPPPKFHAGGLSPDESPVTMRRGEAMLSGQGRRALGDDTIREANAGRGDSGGGAQRGQIVYKHRAFEYFVADHLQMNGTLAKTIRKGDRVGQLRRGRA